ncbi:hypothetical protein C0Q70_04329 [Pomacea canaliculata]|uniref:Methionine synthase reductase n=1 Tax=Pomacea canaliculata TaxID=400727 RepID=A0A2T7PVA7_POMCA|nr:hypothetical protein C0Q70_04329 [Pomacea canaliculata]
MSGCGTQHRFLLLYGSQTGQAKAIAEEICEHAGQHGLLAELHCLSLGDTNYTNFCNNAKNIDRRLQELGAKRFYPSGFADDAVGLEVVVDPWIEGLFPALQNFLHVDPAVCITSRVVSSAISAAYSTDIADSGNESKQAQKQTEAIIENESFNAKTSDHSDLKISSNNMLIDSKMKENAFSADINNSMTVNRRKFTDDKNILLSGVGPQVLSDSEGVKLEDAVDLIASNAVTDTIDKKSSAENADQSTIAEAEAESKHSSLQTSIPPLSESSLTLPADLPRKLEQLPWQNNLKLPSAACDIFMAKIVSARRLTSSDAAKKTLLIRLDVGNKIDYRPGDSISIVCSNTPDDVIQIIDRLGLQDVADLPLRLSVLPNTQKRRAAVPGYLPEEVSSLQYILRNCVDIREVPKKALLRVLVEHTSNPGEKRRLQELCSKEGGDDYATFLRGANVSLLDVLRAFPSCSPPVERLLEHLSRLQPRPYSACSCRDWNPGHLDIAFNVVEIPPTAYQVMSRRGLCTGWLDDITRDLQDAETNAENHRFTEDFWVQMTSLHLSDVQVPIFARINQNFRPPSDLSTPIIMIGPGTGVAPFIGFLQERELLRREMANKEEYGETWLLFGCRSRDKDFLFRSEIEDFQQSGTLTRFLLSFSREELHDGSAKYVYDNLRTAHP